jgi:hypothetical protein
MINGNNRKIMKFTNFLKLIVCLAIFICPLSAEKDIFLLATVPKSGTHLIQNLISIFTGKNLHFFHNAYELNGLTQKNMRHAISKTYLIQMSF